jgi:hypothetical protein
MEWQWLSFLMSPWFVLPWFGFGLAVAVWLLHDQYWVNTQVMPPLKVGWIILAPFFSMLLLLLYLFTCRPPCIQEVKDPQRQQQVHHEYVEHPFKGTFGAVIHCVAGDGLGIMTAMVLSRIWGLSFWPEFVFEYATGYAFGWFIFQLWSMRDMGNGWAMALAKAFRAEFFSMLTVMYGMGLVTRFITPTVVGHRPTPDSLAFWGFSALGLFVGFVFTYPMNWWMVRLGWKHGMG